MVEIYSVGFDVADDTRRKNLRDAITELGKSDKVTVYPILQSQYLVRFEVDRGINLVGLKDRLKEGLASEDDLLVCRVYRTKVEKFGATISRELRGL